MAQKTRIKRVPATTNNVTTGIINQLITDGHSAARINVQGQFVDAPANHTIFGYLRALKGLLARFGLHIGTYQKSGSRKGVADILCCLKHNGGVTANGEKNETLWYHLAGVGIFVAIEIKTGVDQMSEDQHDYKREVEKAGGQYIVFHTFEAFTKWYNASEFKPR